MAYCCTSRENGRRGISARSPGSTTPRVCASRVVVRNITGVSNRSLASNASLIIARASAASAGSKSGTLAILAKYRLSCSFCDEYMPGSSATSTTKPAFVPA